MQNICAEHHWLMWSENLLQSLHLRRQNFSSWFFLSTLEAPTSAKPSETSRFCRRCRRSNSFTGIRAGRAAAGKTRVMPTSAPPRLGPFVFLERYTWAHRTTTKPTCRNSINPFSLERMVVENQKTKQVSLNEIWNLIRFQWKEWLFRTKNNKNRSNI